MRRACSGIFLLQDASRKMHKEKTKRLVFLYAPPIIQLSLKAYLDPIFEHVPLSDDALDIIVPIEATASWSPHLGNGLK